MIQERYCHSWWQCSNPPGVRLRAGAGGTAQQPGESVAGFATGTGPMHLHTYLCILRNRREVLVSAGNEMCAWSYVLIEFGRAPIAVRLAKQAEIARLA